MRLSPLRRLLRGTEPVQQITTSVLIASCLALQLGGTVHLAVVEHELCGEHGEAIDVAGSGHTHGRGAAETSGEDEAPSPSHESESTSDGEAHDHCPLAEDRNGRALVVQAASSGPCCESITLGNPAPAAHWSLSPSALRLLAPKTSPPA